MKSVATATFAMIDQEESKDSFKIFAQQERVPELFLMPRLPVDQIHKPQRSFNNQLNTE